MIHKDIPWQCPGKQVANSSSTKLGQENPPFLGGMQSLARDLIPISPQTSEHLLHSPHSDQL